jgi:hypothetical protein
MSVDAVFGYALRTATSCPPHHDGTSQLRSGRDNPQGGGLPFARLRNASLFCVEESSVISLRQPHRNFAFLSFPWGMPMLALPRLISQKPLCRGKRGRYYRNRIWGDRLPLKGRFDIISQPSRLWGISICVR